MSPDERNIGGHLRKAVSFKASKDWMEANSGVYVAKKTLRDLLVEVSESYEIYYLREDGRDIREEVTRMKNPLFVLGDHIGVRRAEEDIILEFSSGVLSVSRLSLMAEQCVAIVNYELDRTNI
jgi:tRNA (pseudouridine54-N1)-methyltransferase